MSIRPFRFGLSVGGTTGRDDFVATVRMAEASGFDVISSADHISPRLAVLPMLATAAEISTLRISPMVIANDYRHPVILAKETATIDVLSGGRFELGIGTGWIEDQYTAAGIPYDPPRLRVDRFEEAITVIKGCWTGTPFTFRGEHYQVDQVTCPRPIQRPHPPVLVAGAGRRMLRLAGREANIVSIAPLTRGISGFDEFDSAVATSGDRIEAQLGWVHETAQDRFKDIELSVMAHHVEVTPDLGETVARLASETGTAEEQVLDSPHMLIGPIERIIETLLDNRERFGISYVVFLGADLDTVIPVVEQLSGQ